MLLSCTAQELVAKDRVYRATTACRKLSDIAVAASVAGVGFMCHGVFASQCTLCRLS